jgi:hypothetical protein
MNSQPPRNYARIAVALAMAAAIVAAAVFATSAYDTSHQNTTAVDTTTVFSVSTQTLEGVTVIVTGGATPPAGNRLYDVIFKQSGACTPTAYAAPWSVTLGPWTVAEPSNASLPIGSGEASPSYVNSSVIAFAVPNGEYPYQLAVSWGFENPSGVISVNGADVMVLLQGPEVSCTTSTIAAG